MTRLTPILVAGAWLLLSIPGASQAQVHDGIPQAIQQVQETVRDLDWGMATLLKTSSCSGSGTGGVTLSCGLSCKEGDRLMVYAKAPHGSSASVAGTCGGKSASCITPAEGGECSARASPTAADSAGSCTMTFTGPGTSEARCVTSPAILCVAGTCVDRLEPIRPLSLPLP